MNQYELAEFVNEKLTAGCRRLLFGEPEVDPSYISTDTLYLYSAVQLQFLFCYYEWMRQGRPKAQGHYLKKVFGTFEKLFSQWEFNLDVILYALSNCEQDVLINKEKSFFFDFFNASPFFKYGRLYDIIKKCPEYEKWETLVFKTLKDLISNSKVLQAVDLCEDQKGFVFNGNVYPFNDFFMIEKNGILDNFWILKIINKEKCAANEVRYVYYLLGEPDKEKDIVKKL